MHRPPDSVTRETCRGCYRSADDNATQVLVERLFNATMGALELASVHIGYRLRLYRALADGAHMTPGELATRTATAERYVREWLEQQAVAGFLTVDDGEAEPSVRRYVLPTAHRPVLVDEEDLNHLAPIATLAIGVLGPMDSFIDAFRIGAGVPYDAYGADTREGIAAINRPMYRQPARKLARLDPTNRRPLARSSPAHVADVARGSGWSSIAIARAYPDVIVDAIDVDTASIETARSAVAAAGLAGRVRAVGP